MYTVFHVESESAVRNCQILQVNSKKWISEIQAKYALFRSAGFFLPNDLVDSKKKRRLADCLPDISQTLGQTPRVTAALATGHSLAKHC